MNEPEFYVVKRSGILFGDGISVTGESGKYYGISRELFDKLKASGKVSESVKYLNIHTWEDWGLFCTDVSINSPEVEKNTVSVPGRHGVLDYSETLTGAPVFHNREIVFSFVKMGKMESWHDLYSEILGDLHGNQTCFVIDTDPGYYYTGRCNVSSVREDGICSSFTITVDADPFKYAITDTLSDWLWDPFNFETGTAQYYKNCLTLSAGETGSVSVYNFAGNVYPIVILKFSGVNGGMVELQSSAGINGEIFTATSNTIVRFIMASHLKRGENILKFKSDESNETDCTISISFREARF